MNLDKIPKNQSDPSEKFDSGLEAIEGLEFSEAHSLGEQLEFDFFVLHEDLEQTVQSIPEDSPQRFEAENILDKFRQSLC